MSTAMSYYTPASDYMYAYNGSVPGSNTLGRQTNPASQPPYYYETKQLPSILLPNPNDFQPFYQKQQRLQQQAPMSNSPGNVVIHPAASPYLHPMHAQPQQQFVSQNNQMLQQMLQQMPQQMQQQQQQQPIVGYPMQYNAYGKDQIQSGYQLPLSPASLDLDSRHSQPSAAPSKNNSIDYSSIVSSTLSTRRSKRKSKNFLMSTNDTLQQQFPCPKCTKVFQKPYNLKSHMKTHSDEKPYQCKVCDRKFARSHDKKRHESLHGGEKNFKCEGYLKEGHTKWGCGKTFARSDALLRHFRTETGWLCIKPLMDEAKESENRESTVNAALQQHGIAPIGMSAPPQKSQQSYIPFPNAHPEVPSLMDNSDFIRKLVNNRY